MADIARANNRLQNTNNESTTIQIRLIKIRTFSKSLSICTGILLSSTCNINNLPNYSRVQILCRKTKENVKQYNISIKYQPSKGILKNLLRDWGAKLGGRRRAPRRRAAGLRAG